MAHRLRVLRAHLEAGRARPVSTSDCSDQVRGIRDLKRQQTCWPRGFLEWPASFSFSDFRTGMSRSPITTHVLDTSLGQPGRGVPVELSYSTAWDGGNWQLLASGSTDEDGRCSNLLPPGDLRPGTYRIRFDTKTYFASTNNHKPFYPYVEVVFTLEQGSQHYHIPLLLSPFSYTTYRGS